MHTLALLGVLVLQGAAADSLTLADAISRARQLRGDSRVAAGLVEEARAHRGVAGQVSNPIGSYQYTGNTPRQHATVSQPFDWLLVRESNRSAAGAVVTRAEAESTVTATDITAGVRLSFYEALAAQQALALARASKRIADSLSLIADRRFAGGDISRFEDDQVALEAARVGQLVSRAREALTVALGNLARAIAWSGPSSELQPAGSLDEGLHDESLVPADATALPFVRVAVAESTAADYRRQSADRARIPMPAIEAGAEWNDPADPGKTFVVVGLAIPLPIWNQGGREAAVARAQSQQAAGLAQEARLEGARRLSEAATRRREAAERARTAQDSLLPSAIRLRERATAAFRAGETGVVPVLDALRAEREVALSVILELLTYQNAVTEWNRLLGIDQ